MLSLMYLFMAYKFEFVVPDEIHVEVPWNHDVWCIRLIPYGNPPFEITLVKKG